MKFGVIIVTYNRIKLLKECIEHVLAQSVPFTKIIIVNNNSTDGTETLLQDYAGQDDRFDIITLSDNIGGAGGFNKGLAKSSTLDLEWTLLIDDDAFIEPNYIAEIEKLINTKDNVAFSGTVIENGSIPLQHRRVITNKTLLTDADVPLSQYKKDTFEYDLSSFCGLVIKNEIIKTIGLPRQDFFIWLDDTEYSMRICKISKILNVNAAELNHRVKSVSPDVDVSWKSYYGYRNFIFMGHDHTNNKFVFACFILARHIYHMLKGFFGFIFTHNKKYSYEMQLHHDILHDGLHNVTGKNSTYFPH